MRRFLCCVEAILVALAIAFAVPSSLVSCQKPVGPDPQEQTDEDDPGTDPSNPGGTGEEPGGESGEDPGGSEENPGTDPDNPGTDPDNPGPDDPVTPSRTITVLDPGAQRSDDPVYPSHPDLVREVECSEFYDSFYDWIDPDFGNVDYVLGQGKGTAWPLVLENGHIRLYQASGSKGGNFIRIRAKYDARLLSVTVGTASATKISYTLDGKARRSSVIALAAGDRRTFDATELASGVSEICLYCEGTSQSERWELDFIKVKYSGGWTEEDFVGDPVEYGPLVRIDPLPYKEDFESSTFPTTDKNTYDKYGLTAGPENLQWSTWYGCFSWQYPKEISGRLGGKSVQLRVYQEDADYEKTQYGHVCTEFFIEGLTKVSFKYYFSEFWVSATVSYCEFGSSQWSAPQSVVLENYSDRQTLRDFTYVLDGGRPHNAKIKIEIDPSTGHPSSGHYDLIFDEFVFE